MPGNVGLGLIVFVVGGVLFYGGLTGRLPAMLGAMLAPKVLVKPA